MQKSVLSTFIALFLVLLIGSTGLVLTDHISFAKAIYFTLETITTVGYGDVDINTDAGHIVLVLLMVAGVAVMINITGLFTAFLVEGQLTDVYRRKRMVQRINSLQDHVILCGAGRVGRHVLNSLCNEGIQCVVIESQEDIVNDLLANDILVIKSDATEDETLLRAGILKAKGIITALPEDSLNVFVTVTAKGLNPDIYVVARMDKFESEKKLIFAGANKVLSPATLGGRRMAMSLIKPRSVDYMETVINDPDSKVKMEEIKIKKGSCLVGKTLAYSGIKQETGAMVVAILRHNDVISNPSAEEKLLLEDVLIVLGLRDQLKHLASVASGLSN